MLLQCCGAGGTVTEEEGPMLGIPAIGLVVPLGRNGSREPPVARTGNRRSLDLALGGCPIMGFLDDGRSVWRYHGGR